MKYTHEVGIVIVFIGAMLRLIAPADRPVQAPEAQTYIVEDCIRPRHQLRESDIIRNSASEVDGAGLAVQTTVEVMARMQEGPELKGFVSWCKARPGGCYPSKLDKQLNDFGSDRHLFKVPSHVDVRGKEGEPDAFKMLAVWIKDRPVMVTYFGGTDTRYKTKINHVVIVLDYDEKTDKACFLDTNFVEQGKRYQWTTATDLRKRITDDGKNKPWVLIVTKE